MKYELKLTRSKVLLIINVITFLDKKKFLIHYVKIKNS